MDLNRFMKYVHYLSISRASHEEDKARKLPFMPVDKSFHKRKDVFLFTSKQTPMEIKDDSRMSYLQMFNSMIDVLKLTQSEIKPTRDTTTSLDRLLG